MSRDYPELRECLKETKCREHNLLHVYTTMHMTSICEWSCDVFAKISYDIELKQGGDFYLKNKNWVENSKWTEFVLSQIAIGLACLTSKNRAAQNSPEWTGKTEALNNTRKARHHVEHSACGGRPTSLHSCFMSSVAQSFKRKINRPDVISPWAWTFLNSKAIFRHESGELGPNFTQTLPSTHAQRGGRFSAQTCSQQQQILHIIPA